MRDLGDVHRDRRPTQAERRAHDALEEAATGILKKIHPGRTLSRVLVRAWLIPRLLPIPKPSLEIFRIAVLRSWLSLEPGAGCPRPHHLLQGPKELPKAHAQCRARSRGGSSSLHQVLELVTERLQREVSEPDSSIHPPLVKYRQPTPQDAYFGKPSVAAPRPRAHPCLRW